MCTKCQGEQRFAHSTSALGLVDVPRLQSTLPSKGLLPNADYTQNLTVMMEMRTPRTLTSGLAHVTNPPIISRTRHKVRLCCD
jgi:hypothetical protein